MMYVVTVEHWRHDPRQAVPPQGDACVHQAGEVGDASAGHLHAERNTSSTRLAARWSEEPISADRAHQGGEGSAGTLLWCGEF